MSSRYRLPTRPELEAGGRRLRAILTTHWSLLLLLLVGGGVFALAVAGSSEVYENVVDADELAALDQPVLDGAIELRNPTLDAVVTAYTHLGGIVWAPILTALLVVGLSLLWRSFTPVVLMLLAAAGSLAMTAVGKAAVARERPPMDLSVPPYEYSPAFPSGHALNATVIAGVVAYLYVVHGRSKRLAALVVVLAVCHAVLMGMSRVYLGHHWLTDVVVAWFMGAAWLALVLTAHQLLLRRMARRSDRDAAAATVRT